MPNLVRTTSVGKRKFEGLHELFWNKETKVRKTEGMSRENLRNSQEGEIEIGETWQHLTIDLKLKNFKI